MRKLILTGFLAFALFSLYAEIRDKLAVFLPLHTDLTVISSDGTRSRDAHFSRPSPAFTHDFRRVAANVPRFSPGGLLMEYGGKTEERGARNLLPAGSPVFEPAGTPVRSDLPDAASFSGKWALRPVPLAEMPMNGSRVFSFCAKGKGELRVTGVLRRKDGREDLLKEEIFPLESAWKRFYVKFNSGTRRNPGTSAVSFRALFQAEEAEIAAPMLEGPGVYFGVGSPTTYVPRGAFREADKLKLPFRHPGLDEAGAVSFEFIPTTLGGWQGLLSADGGWKPELQLSHYTYSPASARFTLQFRGRTIHFPFRLEAGKKCHLAVNWDREKFSLFVNGRKAGEANAPGAPLRAKELFLGSRSIQVSSCGVFRNFALFAKTLTEAEIRELAENADLAAILPAKEVSRITPFSVFPMNSGVCAMHFQSSREVVSAELRIGGFRTGSCRILPGGLECRFDPAYLMPGKYTMELKCSFRNGSGGTFPFPVEITGFLRPWENVQISAWNEYRPEFASTGVTIAGAGLEAAKIDELARNGFYSSWNLHYFGTPRPGNPDDVAVDSFGKAIYPDIRSPHIREDIRRYGDMVARRIRYAPAFKAIVLNSEQHAGGAGNSGSFNFSTGEVTRARSFGLDLEKWRLRSRDGREIFSKFMPLGYLGTAPAPELVPDSRIIPADNPLYAYLRERHGPDGGTEVVMNDLLAETIRKTRPDLLLMQDPILRRPPLRSYRKINVAQDWVYYTDLSALVKMAERLGATARGIPGMTTSVMPQFLFKPGMAAPFGGMPPRDMFREACYLAASRPMRVISFWNIGTAFVKGAQQSPDEVRALLGDADFREAERRIREKKLKIFCFDPRLKEEFRAVSDHLWIPFGALMPKWKNAPRRVALVDSFASDIFGNVRWPDHGVLGNALVKTGIPYDILYDNDLETGIGDYDVLVLPVCGALPERAVENLRNFMRRGRLVIADQFLKVKGLEQALILRAEGKNGTELRRKELELLRRYEGKTDSPAYMESMQALLAEADARSELPRLAELLREKLKTAFAAEERNVYWNHLRAGGADYLFAVNDLRVPGEIYGRFGKIREQGIARHVFFRVRNPEFRHAYDLTGQKELPVRDGHVKLDLPPCGGRIVLFTRNPLGRFSASAPDKAVRGNPVRIDLCLEKGAGLIPVQLDVRMPGHSTSFFSRYDVLRNGTLAVNFILPFNAPPGTWSVRVRELAAGQEAVCPFTVGE